MNWSLLVPKKSRRKTGATEEVRMNVITRAMFKCERCGNPLNGPMSVHHRRPRAMGGTKRLDTNYPSNLMALCGTGTSGCHGWIEQNRETAYEEGWLVRQNEDPSTIKVKLFLYGWSFISNEGIVSKANG